MMYKQHKAHSAESIADLWCIGAQWSQWSHTTPDTQRGTCSVLLSSSRRYRADCMYSAKSLNPKLACDTLWSDVKLLLQKKYTPVSTYTNGVLLFHTHYHLLMAILLGNCYNTSSMNMVLLHIWHLMLLQYKLVRVNLWKHFVNMK